MKRRKYIYFPIDCFYCGISLNNKYEHTYDHIEPLAKGGKDKFENLADCCYKCNQLKADKSLKEFKQFIEEKYNNTSPKSAEYSYLSDLIKHLEKFTFS